MAGSITPLPVMLEEEDRKIYDKLEPPKSMVFRYGYQKLIAELPYDGDAKPGCGTRLVVRTQRGMELAEMLTSTCPNSGCGKSISRKEMLEYIKKSGGKDYPFYNQGKILRLATAEDLHEQAQLDDRKPKMIQFTKSLIREMDLDMRLVDVELLLGGERMIFYYTAEHWVDFRELVQQLASEFQTRIEMDQVNAREEARLVADYERCGQYCCCKSFLKVLKPVSMRSAKMQKATLDPTKISGRCGRLMCCLRYEDKTYDDLRKRLLHRRARVQTDDGLGTVIDTQILTQLVLIKLDSAVQSAAYPLENIQSLTKEQEAELKARLSEQVTTPAKAPSAGTPAPPRDRTKAEAPPEKGQSQADSASGSDQRRDSQESDGDKAGGRRGKRRRRRRRRNTSE